MQFKYLFNPTEVMNLFRQYFGPTKVAFAELDEAGQREPAVAPQSLWEEYNPATDRTVTVTKVYLGACAIRA